MTKLLVTTITIVALCQPSAVEYRLLHRGESAENDPDNAALCVISIDKCIIDEELKHLVCSVVNKEKMQNKYKAFRVQIHYKLDTYWFEIASATTGYLESLVAIYRWRAPNSSQLLRRLDDQCKICRVGDSKIEFNHKDNCK